MPKLEWIRSDGMTPTPRDTFPQGMPFQASRFLPTTDTQRTHRKPMLLFVLFGLLLFRFEQRTLFALLL